MLVLSCLIVTVLVTPSFSYESFFGECPLAPAMPNFDMENFEGIWYMIESFSDGLICVTWNISKSSRPGVWNLREMTESGLEYSPVVKHALAEITQPDPRRPGRLRIAWTHSWAGDSAFTIYNTDYEKFAGVFECQNVGLYHKQNGIVLSRTPNLRTYRKQIARVGTDSIDPGYYRPVHQDGCTIRPRQDGIGRGLGSSPIRGSERKPYERPDVETAVFDELEY